MRNCPVIVHMHQFKNAGTSFDSFLFNNFDKNFVDHREDKVFKSLSGLSDYIAGESNIYAISSHAINAKKIEYARIKGLNIFSVAFIRHPLERILSVYRFEKHQLSDTPGARAAKKYVMRDYVKWRLDNRPEVICNYQARNLCITDEFCFSGVLKGAAIFNILYVVDDIGEKQGEIFNSINAFGFSLSHQEITRENATTHASLSINDKIGVIKREIGGELLNELYKNNLLDLTLYDYVSRGVNNL